MNEYEYNLIFDFLREVIDKSIVSEEKLTVKELESYNITQHSESDLIILREYFLKQEQYIYVAYLQKKLDEL